MDKTIEYVPPPDPQTLLPPLLACLPAGLVSTRPPPALLPLLSPILRQRVNIFTAPSPSSTPESWLRLLCWGAEKADGVLTLVEGITFELHPVSGEIELPDEITVAYKRVDEETLRAQIQLPEYGLNVLYEWCVNDPDGGTGWRVAELLSRDQTARDEGPWSTSVKEANGRAGSGLDHLNSDSDDDDYWAQYGAQYDTAPTARSTPGSRTMVSAQRPMVSDDSYLARYADVQPAMDHEDPSERTPDIGESSLQGNALAELIQQHFERPQSNGDPSAASSEALAALISHPRPSSASSSGSDTVAKLEQEAETQSASEIGVKQHIGASVKSLYRLAKATGMTHDEFRTLIRTELALLSLADDR
ncbi:hypothetical protein V8E54_012045 [Elaphomyces granulatus]